MATSFPGAVDAFPRPGPETNTDDPGFELDVILNAHSDGIEGVQQYLLDNPPGSGGGSDPWTYLVLSTAWSNTAAPFVNVPGLSVSNLVNGAKYEFRAHILAMSWDGFTNVAVGIGWDSSGAVVYGEAGVWEGLFAVPKVQRSTSTSLSLMPTGGADTSDRLAGIITGVFAPYSATNSLALKVNGNPGTVTYAIMPGSFLAYRRIL